ncbi:MAG: hypothetical protein IJD43_14945 [Thermoguttaceae bacterium]|nr:hypothetical protein [Thermoguttaceae bacterium]
MEPKTSQPFPQSFSPTIPPSISAVVGVTGHRHLFKEDHETLKEKIRTFFLENFQPEERVLVLCGLAEGADQLAAETVLELKRTGRPNLTLIGVLPMPLGFYEEDFAETAQDSNAEETQNAVSADSPRRAFYRLLALADRSVELPLVAGNRERSLAQEPIDRVIQYDLLGAELADSATVILALWDGVTDGLKPGGTGDVVRRAFLKPEKTRVFQIVTPQDRKSHTRPQNALEARWLTEWPN